MSSCRKAETLSVYDCSPFLSEKLSALGLKIKKGDTDIAVLGEGIKTPPSVNAEIVFVPESLTDIGNINCLSAVSAGMGSKASLSFSSLEEESGVMSVNRNVDFSGKTIYPCEVKIPLFGKLSLYENLVHGFLSLFM